MKRFLMFLGATFFIIMKMFAIDVIGSINNRGEISSSDKFIDSFWNNPNLSHNASSYVEKYKTSINTNDGHYLIRLSRHTDRANEDIKESIETFGDVFFSKLDIEYYQNNGTKASSQTILNDGLWYKYNYWTFATYTNTPWKETKDITVNVVNMTGDCKALILRGERDSIDPPLLSIFMLYQGQIKLVFNKKVEINSVNNDVSQTLFEVQENKYDSNGQLTPKKYYITCWMN